MAPGSEIPPRSGQPLTGERGHEDFDDNGVSSDLVPMAEGHRRSRKIGFSKAAVRVPFFTSNLLVSGAAVERPNGTPFSREGACENRAFPLSFGAPSSAASAH
jgi:hypothetical protein